MCNLPGGHELQEQDPMLSTTHALQMSQYAGERAYQEEIEDYLLSLLRGNDPLCTGIHL